MLGQFWISEAVLFFLTHYGSMPESIVGNKFIVITELRFETEEEGSS
jgi:hypothetical protein